MLSVVTMCDGPGIRAEYAFSNIQVRRLYRDRKIEKKKKKKGEHRFSSVDAEKSVLIRSPIRRQTRCKERRAYGLGGAYEGRVTCCGVQMLREV